MAKSQKSKNGKNILKIIFHKPTSGLMSCSNSVNVCGTYVKVNTETHANVEKQSTYNVNLSQYVTKLANGQCLSVFLQESVSEKFVKFTPVLAVFLVEFDHGYQSAQGEPQSTC